MSPPREDPKEPLRQTSPEGLRGFAALNVVLSHFVAHFMPNLLSRNYPDVFPNTQSPSEGSLAFVIAQSPPASLLYNGNFAVSIFYALSGYVLALPWHQQSTQQELTSCCSATTEQREGTQKMQAQTYRILRRRLWGRFLRLHIPAAASMVFAYVLILGGAYENTKTAFRPEITSHWKRFPVHVPFKRVVQALLGGELLYGMVELNPAMWTLKLELCGSVVLLLYTLAVEPPRSAPTTPSPCPLHLEHAAQGKACGSAPASTFESLKYSWASLVGSATPTTSGDPSHVDRRAWWPCTAVTLSCTIVLVSSVCDLETTLVIAVMLLGAHVPSMPRLSRRAAWWTLALSAYLGAFQYDRAMYFSIPKQSLLSGSKKYNDVAGNVTAAKHPMTYLLGGRIPAKHVVNSAGAVLALLSIVHSGAAEQLFSSRFAIYLGRVSFPVYMVHFQVLVALGGNVFIALPEEILGLSWLPFAIVFFAYVVVSYGLASTIFLAIDKFAVLVSRVVTVRLV